MTVPSNMQRAMLTRLLFRCVFRAEGYDASERSEQSLTEVRQNKQCNLLEGENRQEDKRDDPEEIRSCISRR